MSSKINRMLNKARREKRRDRMFAKRLDRALSKGNGAPNPQYVGVEQENFMLGPGQSNRKHKDEE